MPVRRRRRAAVPEIVDAIGKVPERRAEEGRIIAAAAATARGAAAGRLVRPVAARQGVAEAGDSRRDLARLRETVNRK